MPQLFKHKADKKYKVCKKYTTTLDGKHKEIMNNFADELYNKIPELKQERQELKELLNMDISIDKKMEAQDRIKEINEKIKNIKSNKNDYLLNNSKYIFSYFENKKNIENNVEEKKNNLYSEKSKMLFNMFKVNKEPQTSTETTNIVQQYLSNVDDGFLDMNQYVLETDICQSCHKGELIPLDDEGVLICNVCAVNVPYLIENEKPSYKEPPKEVCFYAYRKINHFKEIIAQFQGKETTQISDEVIFKIQQQIKKERIQLCDLTYLKTKDILKKLGYNKYYEHIAFIKNKLGIKPPIFSPELEETLCTLFLETQAPFSKWAPVARSNYLHYNYALFKLCELLDERQYLDEIPLLIDREKIMMQDEIWKNICMELNWEYIPTA